MQYDFTNHLFFQLLKEYTHRYERAHKCENLLKPLEFAPFNIPIVEWTDPPQCMPDDSKNADTVQAYRNYYINHKKSFAKWTNREIPSWFI